MNPPEIILAITPGDDLMHVATADVLRDHLDEEAPDPDDEPERVPEWEFYAIDGSPRRAVTDAGTGQITGFEPVPLAPAPTEDSRRLLVDRIDAFQARVQVVLDRRIDDGFYDPSPPPFLRSTRFTGDLRAVLIGLDAVSEPPPPGQPHPGSPLHNLWHAVFG